MTMTKTELDFFGDLCSADEVHRNWGNPAFGLFLTADGTLYASNSRSEYIKTMQAIQSKLLTDKDVIAEFHSKALNIAQRYHLIGLNANGREVNVDVMCGEPPNQTQLNLIKMLFRLKRPKNLNTMADTTSLATRVSKELRTL